MPAEDEIRGFVEERFSVRLADVAKLAGDASDRAYYRVLPSGGNIAGHASAVAMYLSAPADEYLPFLYVQRLLAEIGSPAPAVLAHNMPGRIILLEDIGDLSLQDAVNGAEPRKWIELYSQAVDIMIDIQVKGETRCGEGFPCFALAFDEEKLMWELNFFFENALRIYKRAEFSPSREAALREEFTRVCRILAAEPRYLCHRDYHSRNLMLAPDGRLRVIDFQDARMGPLQYDLVSLLCDSYVDMPADIYDKTYAYYLSQLPLRNGPSPDPDHFAYIYDVMAIQRNIKAAGSFAFLDCVKNMNRYLARMPQCLSHVKKALERRSEFSRLREILGEYFEELR